MAYQGRSWPGATLKFVVKDEDPDYVHGSEPVALETEDIGLKADSELFAAAVNAMDNSDVSQTPAPVPYAGGSPTAEERQNQRVQIEQSRRIILDRIRERTSNRTSTGPSSSSLIAGPMDDFGGESPWKNIRH